MTTLLILIIYLSFISLGLPDSLLGSAWPSMYQQMGASITGAGTLAMIISACTIVSSLMSDRVIHKFGTGKVTAVSVLTTAAALFGFSLSGSYWQLALWCIPYGLGAGAVDSALNNYVALHLAARHMSWLHCMWGVGASIGPYIMGWCLSGGRGWASGYRIIGCIQIALTACIVFSLPLWTRQSQNSASAEEHRNVLSIREAVRLPGAKAILAAFLCYCGLEASCGFWAASWMVSVRGISAEKAAGYAALSGLVTIGLGCAPIYPSVIHSTPARFGAKNSQSLVGIQMASAYVGSTFGPKVLGLISDRLSLSVYPVYLAAFLAVMIVMTESSKV